MTNNAQEHINQLTNQKRIRYLDISNRDLAGQADLKEFTALTSLNSYNNKFASLEFLTTLPQKDQLKKITKSDETVIQELAEKEQQVKQFQIYWLLSLGAIVLLLINTMRLIKLTNKKKSIKN